MEPPADIKGGSPQGRVLNRIAAVRRQQRLSLRTVARRMGIDVQTARKQEQATADLRLSDLYAWQQQLNVPVTELLMDPDAPLSRPVMERARLLRLMKTAMAIRERADSEAIERMAQMLVEQLVEIMPELAHVTAWHAVGQRRSLDEYGRIAEYPIPDSFLGDVSQATDY